MSESVTSTFTFSQYSASVKLSDHVSSLLRHVAESKSQVCSHGGYVPLVVDKLMLPRNRVITEIKGCPSIDAEGCPCLTITVTASSGASTTVDAALAETERLSLNSQMNFVNTIIASSVCFKDCGDMEVVDGALMAAATGGDGDVLVERSVLMAVSVGCATVAAASDGVPLWLHLHRWAQNVVEKKKELNVLTVPHVAVRISQNALRTSRLLRESNPFQSTAMDEIQAVFYDQPDLTEHCQAPKAQEVMTPGVPDGTTLSRWMRSYIGKPIVAMDLSERTSIPMLYGVSVATALQVPLIVFPFPPVRGEVMALYNQYIRMYEEMTEYNALA